ncbi:MAG: LegC family aminotransferase [Nitrospirae bacterium]|nr:LegC family aminotransferase [Nitrospirota bacterium]
MIPLSEPEISGNEWKYVKDCLDSGWVSSVGEYVGRFERMVADYTGSRFAVATVNGTAALHVSLIACGVLPGDEVIVPTLTFIAPANAVRYCGAYPVFMDCDPDTLCIDAEKTAHFLDIECCKGKDGHTYNKMSGRRIKALMPVHVFGHPSEMKSLMEICSNKNIDIIEDATEGLGSEYGGKKTGSFGRSGCFSFNGNKIITTGGGGMVVTDDEALAKKVRHLTTQAKTDPVEYDHDEIGYNYRLTNIQSAIGVAQMERLEEFIERKRKNARLYSELLSKVPGAELMWEQPGVRSNFWFYTIRVSSGQKKPLMDSLASKGMQARPVWKLMHTLQMYADCQGYFIEKATEAYERCLNIPCSVGLEPEDVCYVAENIAAFLDKERL